MPSGMMNIAIKNYDELEKDIKDIEKKSEKAVQRTVSDFKSRAPGWISQEIVKEYNIKKKDINKDKKSVSRGGNRIKVAGVQVDNVSIQYQGRLLTPTHFKMKPVAPVPWYECYRNYDKANTVTMKVFKNRPRKALGHKVFLAQSGGSGTTYIPFQRSGKKRLPIEAIKTVSVPQMVTNEKVAEDIHKRIDKELGKRLEHHLKNLVK